MGRWPIKDVQCRGCGKTHKATRANARCLECRRRMANQATLSKRRQSMKFACRCGCGTPVKREWYLKGHTPKPTIPCRCGCGEMLWADRYKRGHLKAAVEAKLCACGCGEPVTSVRYRFRWGHGVGVCMDCGAEVRAANNHVKRCPDCQVESDKRRRSDPANRERVREWSRRNVLRVRASRHGMTVEQYQALYDSQSGRCAICGRADKRLVIDHWHGHGCERVNTSGGTTHCAECVRGLLCGTCNTFIGHAFDDPLLLRRAIAYLERTSQLTLAA